VSVAAWRSAGQPLPGKDRKRANFITIRRHDSDWEPRQVLHVSRLVTSERRRGPARSSSSCSFICGMSSLRLPRRYCGADHSRLELDGCLLLSRGCHSWRGKIMVQVRYGIVVWPG
jgi:hypothetical protein